ncbi:hypothetical protein [Ralstonia sp. 24A2]|uniref:hypothetical protein n=1 Tax=Ralstonia sp. 24A2 TaxID=3447364 RepID=UPI003F699D1E
MNEALIRILHTTRNAWGLAAEQRSALPHMPHNAHCMSATFAAPVLASLKNLRSSQR